MFHKEFQMMVAGYEVHVISAYLFIHQNPWKNEGGQPPIIWVK